MPVKRSRDINPFYAARTRRVAPAQPVSLSVEKVAIGEATLFRADCFDAFPNLSGIEAVVTDPPYGIGYASRTAGKRPVNPATLLQEAKPV